MKRSRTKAQLEEPYISLKTWLHLRVSWNNKRIELILILKDNSCPHLLNQLGDPSRYQILYRKAKLRTLLILPSIAWLRATVTSIRRQYLEIRVDCIPRHIIKWRWVLNMEGAIPAQISLKSIQRKVVLLYKSYRIYSIHTISMAKFHSHKQLN